MSTILQPDVYQAEYRGQYVKPVEGHAFFGVTGVQEFWS
jgi:hypothetical protein